MNDLRPCPACAMPTPHRFCWRVNQCAIYACRVCGLGAAEAQDFDPAGYYTGAYFDGTAADGYADYAGSEAVLRAEFRRTLAALRDIVPSGRLLEIGAAYGFFLMEAQAHFAVRGVEMADEAAVAARARGLDVVSGPATPAAFAAPEPWDAIVMLDVIEHLDDPAGVVQQCAAHLRPGGALMLTTGDFGSIVARLAGQRWRLMTPPQHLWFFTHESLTRLGHRFGLVAERVEHPWKRVPVSLIAYQLGRMTGINLKADRVAGLSSWGVPLNLFDSLRVIFRKS
ncbi:MAG: class I SAM-dependent methyltransferase [Rhodospirillaceae bacterium]|nr:class I SAM-dependent methyltransferase [Rhodospirillaceae bacterium]